MSDNAENDARPPHRLTEGERQDLMYAVPYSTIPDWSNMQDVFDLVDEYIAVRIRGGSVIPPEQG